MLNRSALIVRPAQPYIAWARGLDDSDVTPAPDGEQTVYLVREVENDDDLERLLSEVYAVVFERELNGWHTVEEDWPRLLGKIYALHRHTGKPVWKLQPLEKSQLGCDLVSDGERLFVTTRNSGDHGESAVVAVEAKRARSATASE